MIEIYNEDCFERINKMEPASVDCVITDIPYNSTKIKYDQEIFDTSRLSIELRRILKPSGWFFLFSTLTQFPAFLDQWKLKFDYIWVYDQGTPIIFLKNIKRPFFQHEHIFAFQSKDLQSTKDVYFDREALRIEGQAYIKERKRDRSKLGEFELASRGGSISGLDDIFCFNTDNKGWREGTTILYNNKERKRYLSDGQAVHPTMKPISLISRLVKAYTRPGELIFDPCCGSGTTLIAASQHGRKAIGCEKDPIRYTRTLEYIAMNQVPIENEQQQQTKINEEITPLEIINKQQSLF